MRLGSSNTSLILGTTAIGRIYQGGIRIFGDAPIDIGNPITIQEYSYHHSGTNHDGTGSSELTDSRTFVGQIAAADDDITYTVSGEFIWINGVPGSVAPTGAQPAPDASNYSVSGWTGLSSVTDVIFQHDNFDAPSRDPDANGGVPVTNYVDDFLGMVDAWETNASPSGDRTYWINSYVFDGGTFFPDGSGGPSSATETNINNWIAASINETSGGYAAWTDDFVSQVQAARPSLDIRHMDINRVWISLYQNTAFGNVDFGDIFIDDAPHGHSDSYLMIGLIQYIYKTGRRPHASYTPSAGDGISSEIIDNWSDIVDYAYNEIYPVSTGIANIGLVGVQDYSTMMFNNVLKSAREVNFGATTLNSERYPTALNGANPEWITLWGQSTNATHLAGRYRFAWDGDGTFTLSGGGVSNVDTSTSGQIEFDFSPTGFENESGLSIICTALGATQLSNMRCAKTSNWAAMEAGEIWESTFLSDFSNARSFRFMDPLDTNNSTVSSWSDRNTLNSLTWQYDGIPIEAIVDVANRTGVKPWINIPHLADDTYVTNTANYMRDNLRSDVNFILEYTNEPWNFVFDQLSDMSDLAVSEWGMSTDTLDQALEWYGVRAYEIFGLFETSFGGTDRFDRFVSTQTDFTALSTKMLDAPFAVSNGHVPEAPHNRVDIYGITNYFFKTISDQDLLDYFNENGQDAFNRYLYDHVLDQIQNTTSDYWADAITEAASYGLSVGSYEGGTHIVRTTSTTDNSTLDSAYLAFAKSASDAELHKVSIQEWESLRRVGDYAWTPFVATGRHSQYGAWSLNEYVGENSLRYQLWDAYNEGNTLPTFVLLPDAPTDLTTTEETSSTLTVDATVSGSQQNVRYRENGTSTWSTESDVTLPYQITGLSAATDYDVQIQDQNANGEGGLWSNTSVFDTAAGASVPGQMGAPTLTSVSSTELSAAFAADPADNGSAITSYDLRYSTDESTWTTDTDVSDPHSITGLSASTLYYVQMRAVNGAGAGPWSTSATETTDAAASNAFVNFTGTQYINLPVVAGAVDVVFETTIRFDSISTFQGIYSGNENGVWVNGGNIAFYTDNDDFQQVPLGVAAGESATIRVESSTGANALAAGFRVYVNDVLTLNAAGAWSGGNVGGYAFTNGGASGEFVVGDVSGLSLIVDGTPRISIATTDNAAVWNAHPNMNGTVTDV